MCRVALEDDDALDLVLAQVDVHEQQRPRGLLGLHVLRVEVHVLRGLVLRRRDCDQVLLRRVVQLQVVVVAVLLLRGRGVAVVLNRAQVLINLAVSLF